MVASFWLFGFGDTNQTRLKAIMSFLNVRKIFYVIKDPLISKFPLGNDRGLYYAAARGSRRSFPAPSAEMDETILPLPCGKRSQAQHSLGSQSQDFAGNCNWLPVFTVQPKAREVLSLHGRRRKKPTGAAALVDVGKT